MRHSSLSSKIQAAAADVARPDLEVSEGRRGKQAALRCRCAGKSPLAWDLDRTRGFNGRKLRQGVQLSVRRKTGAR